MEKKLFSIYRSSAGSGKTHTLVKEYLLLALRFRADYYKHILAVTFTNKATQEMKKRILTHLHSFSNGNFNTLAYDLMKELNIDEVEFRLRTNELQTEILHHYSQFSICTIDSFFQKIIRAFTREAGLSGDYRLELDTRAVLSEVVNSLIEELGTNKQLTDWMVAYAIENLENDRAWDVRSSLIHFADELFREEFRAIEDTLFRTTSSENYFSALQEQLSEKRYTFIHTIQKISQEAIAYIHKQGWDSEDFKYKQKGAYNFFLKFQKIKHVADTNASAIGSQSRNQFQDEKNWGHPESAHCLSIEHAAQTMLIPKLNQLLNFRDKYYQDALSAEVVLKNFYAFGLLADLSRKLRQYKQENNVMLLPDAPKFLSGLIQDSDTPFIYEKTGAQYRNYLIDEFQDTSGMQWKNFKPLVINNLDQGYPSMVVGDVKQSIYRWRGGDLKLLQQDIEEHIGKERVNMKELTQNFRSAVTIVHFNNKLFHAIANHAQAEMNSPLIGSSYHDVEQHETKQNRGMVSVQFIKKNDSHSSWKEEALSLIPHQLEELQDKGVPLSEVAFLVRKNSEGEQIASYLLQHKNKNPQSSYQYNVISNESLRIDGASSVALITNTLRYLLNTHDLIARANLAHNYYQLFNSNYSQHESFSVTNKKDFETKMPSEFIKRKNELKKLPLYELTETLIDIFLLQKIEGEQIYIESFQNIVYEFSHRENDSISSFLQWWDDHKTSKSIQFSGKTDAAQIYTIHKSKGLQFKFVIIPFCSWEIDHSPINAPLLWVTKDNMPPYSNSYLPVNYSSILKDTFFEQDYQQEKTRVYLDNLNLLYVAFTRAEQGLFVLAPHPDALHRKNNIASTLFSIFSHSKEFAENWNGSSNEWKTGEISISTSYNTIGIDGALPITGYQTAPWRTRLLLQKTNANVFTSTKEDDHKNKKRGIILHAILARIRYAKDVDAVLQQAVNDGLLPKTDLEGLLLWLKNILSIPKVAHWFSDAWQVQTEATILLPNKPTMRVDRVLLSNHNAVVIDYKTGQPNQNDAQQVLEYMNVLHQMGYTHIEGYLFYIVNGEIHPVSRYSKTRKPIDENQLSIDM